MGHSLASLILFRALMAWSVSASLVSSRRLGRIAAVLVGVFIAVAFGEGMTLVEILSALTCGLTVLIVGFGFFCVGWMSGADARMTAAIATWLGWSNLLPFAAGLAIIGLAAWPLQNWWRARPLPERYARISWLQRLHARTSAPFGAAAAIMAVALYPGLPDGFGALFGI